MAFAPPPPLAPPFRAAVKAPPPPSPPKHVWTKAEDLRLIEIITSVHEHGHDPARAWSISVEDPLLPRASSDLREDTITLHKNRFYNVRDKLFTRANKRDPHSFEELRQFLQERDYEAARTKGGKRKKKFQRREDASGGTNKEGAHEIDEENAAKEGKDDSDTSTSITHANDPKDAIRDIRKEAKPTIASTLWNDPNAYWNVRLDMMKVLLNTKEMRELFDIEDGGALVAIDANKHAEGVLKGLLRLRVVKELVPLPLKVQTLYDMLQSTTLNARVPSYASHCAHHNKDLTDLLAQMATPVFLIACETQGASNDTHRFHKQQRNWSLLVFAEDPSGKTAPLVTFVQTRDRPEITYQIASRGALHISTGEIEKPRRLMGSEGPLPLTCSVFIKTRDSRWTIIFELPSSL